MSEPHYPSREATFVSDEYLLPNDSPEHARLEQQSRALTAMMHGQTIHAPLDRPSRICDVGCGTGSVSVTLGHNNPTADVLGIDLSKVPTLHAPLRNVSYIQGDIRRLAGQDPKLQFNSMDLAFSRLLIHGMQDWPGFVKIMADLTKPGGFVEIQELSVSLYDYDRRVPDEAFEPLREMVAVYQDLNMDMHAGENVSKYMQEAGLQNVQVKEYKWTFGPWNKDADTDSELIGKCWSDATPEMQIMLARKIFEGRYPQERVEELVRLTVEAMGPRPGRHFKYFVTVGQKPH